MGFKRVLGIIPNEVFLSDLSDKKYPRPDEIQDGFLIANTIYRIYMQAGSGYAFRCLLIRLR